MGGLNDFLTLIFSPLISIFLPSLLARNILNTNFRYDDNSKKHQQKDAGLAKVGKKKMTRFSIDENDIINERAGIISRLQVSLAKISLMPIDLFAFSTTFWGLRRFSVGFCSAFCADNLCCCRKSRSIKIYQRGQEQMDKRLDIVKLIRTSLDVDLLKKLYLLPN